VIVYYLNAMAVLIGSAIAPRRVLAAWRAARSARALYRSPMTYEQALSMTIGELRAHLGVPEEGLATAGRRLHPDAQAKRGPAGRGHDVHVGGLRGVLMAAGGNERSARPSRDARRAERRRRVLAGQQGVCPGAAERAGEGGCPAPHACVLLEGATCGAGSVSRETSGWAAGPRRSRSTWPWRGRASRSSARRVREGDTAWVGDVAGSWVPDPVRASRGGGFPAGAGEAGRGSGERAAGGRGAGWSDRMERSSCSGAAATCG
jgi:hypothetical protein